MEDDVTGGSNVGLFCVCMFEIGDTGCSCLTETGDDFRTCQVNETPVKS